MIGAARAASEILARAARCQRRPRTHPRRLGEHVHVRSNRSACPSLADACSAPSAGWRPTSCCSPPGVTSGSRSRSSRAIRSPAASATSSTGSWRIGTTRQGPEEPVYVPYHRLFGRRRFSFPDLEGAAEIELDKIRPKTRDAVNEMIAEHLGEPLTPEEMLPDATLDLLGLDSLERMELALAIEDRFGFRSDRVADTLGELWALAEGVTTGSTEEDVAVPAAWTKQRPAEGPAEPLADTLAEAFVRRALANPGDVATADRIAGVLTYRRLLVGCTLLSKRFRRPAWRGGRRPAAGLRRGRNGLLRAPPGREAAGDDELDHGPGKPRPCRPNARYPPRGHFSPGSSIGCGSRSRGPSTSSWKTFGEACGKRS